MHAVQVSEGRRLLAQAIELFTRAFWALHNSPRHAVVHLARHLDEANISCDEAAAVLGVHW